jgi:hypothetical protein
MNRLSLKSPSRSGHWKAWTRSLAYDANYLIDNKAEIIADAEGTRANRSAEIAIGAAAMDRFCKPREPRQEPIVIDSELATLMPHGPLRRRHLRRDEPDARGQHAAGMMPIVRGRLTR